MINPNDSIKVKNVLSRKYVFHYEEMDQHIEDFINDVFKQTQNIKGPLFYTMNNVPKDEITHVEFFMPVEDDSVSLLDDMHFQSYYNIENMVSICVQNNFEMNTEIAYGMLFQYMEENYLKQVTPIFHVLSGDETLQYMFIKIGVVQDLEEAWK